MGYGNTYTIEAEINTHGIVSQEADYIREIADEAIAEYDLTEKVSEEVEAAVNDQFQDLLTETLNAEPEIVLNALAKAAEQFGDHLKEIAKLQDELVKSSGATRQLAAITVERNKAAGFLKDLGHPAYQDFKAEVQA